MKWCIVFVFAATFNMCERPPAGKEIDRSAIDRAGSIANYSQLRSAPNAASMPFELQFIDTIAANDRAIIELALLVETRSMQPEIKDWARQCLKKRRNELGTFAAIRDSRFASMPEAVNIELPGIREGMASYDLQKADMLKASAFDIEFEKQMFLLLNAGEILSADASLRISGQTNGDGSLDDFADVVKAMNLSFANEKEQLAAFRIK